VERKHNIKKTISMKKFIAELGEAFSVHMKQRLLELEIRCVLTRREDFNRLDLKHVEHIQHDCSSECASGTCNKEFTYGQLLVIDGNLYYSDECVASDKVIQSPIVGTIYNSLSDQDMILNESGNAKKIDDSNIDYVIDTILTVCPQVSGSYMDIMAKYL